MKHFTPSEPPPCEGVTSGVAWKPVVGYEGLYEVSDFGAVRSLPGYCRTGKLLKPTKRSNGYYTVTLCRRGVEKTVKVHRLVASAFVPNQNAYPIIDHLNGNKYDNRSENLSWCTQKMNNHNPITAEKQRIALLEVTKRDEWRALNRASLKKATLACSIPVVCIETGMLYQSAAHASRDVGVAKTNVSKSCKRYSVGNTDTIAHYRGKPVYHFRYATAEETQKYKVA